jgi:[pyruvate, water dikinase]-phosphate phosphotransferase / [pyruvate, water dikinase] kinase
MTEHHIYIVSDGTGETATKITKAALLQFRPANPVITRHSNVRSADSIREIVKAAESQRALIIHTFASHVLRREMEQQCQRRNVPSQDLFGLLMDRLREFIGSPPSEQPGLLHQVDDNYFERMDALSYTVRNDDNHCPEDLQEADIVLVGVSRTSKTPLSVYLAQEGWRVANIPLAAGEQPCAELTRVDPMRVVGLMISPERLVETRRARLSRLGVIDSSYADPAHVREELEFCRKVFAAHPDWMVVDVTGKSVEETAAEITERIFGKERHL